MKLLASLLLIVCVGCAVVKGSRSPDGTLSISSQRFLWSSEGIAFSVNESNRFTTTLSVQKSSPDAQSIHEVFSGVGAIMGSAAAAAAK
jgi:hypothetical protein